MVRSSVSMVWHAHRDCLVRGIAAAISSNDSDRVAAPAALTRAFGAQSHVMRIHNLPVGRGFAIARAIDWLITGDTERSIDRTTVIRRRIADCDVNHLVMRRPQGRLIHRSADNHW